MSRDDPVGRAAQAEPVSLCLCSAYRHGRMGPHRDHVAEYERAKTAGKAPDETALGRVQVAP